MSGRGRGGGRRPTQSFYRVGGGDGGGRGRGGRSGSFPTPSPSDPFSLSSSSQFPSLPTPAPVPVPAASLPASSSTRGLPTSSSSSTSAATLSREVEKLTLQSATPSPASTMSGRGRGGGRRPTQSFYRVGGGDGGGRGRGGRSGSFPTPSPSDPFSLSSSSQFPSLPTPAPVPVPAASLPASSSTRGLPTSSSSSTSAATLSREVEKLTLQSATPSPASTPGANLPPASSENQKPPNRPDIGKAGKKVIIRANHFLVEVADKDLYKYDVTITPELKCKKATRLLINELVRLYKESHMGRRTSAYDGARSLYTAGPLPFGKEKQEFEVKLVDKDKKAGSAERDNQAASARRERLYTVAIKFVAKAHIPHLQQFLASSQREFPQAVIQALNVVLKESRSKDGTVVGRSFFGGQLGSITKLGDGLEYWRGFYQSLRPTQMGLSLNIDVSATAFYEPLPVSDFIKKYLNLTGDGVLDFRDSHMVSKVLKGLKVETSHLGYVRKYEVTGVSALPRHKLMFSYQGREISVAEYFRVSYNTMLTCPNLPALQVGSGSKPVYLPMELCKIVSGQRFSKILNAKQVTKLLRATCQRPAEREESIKQVVSENQYNEKQVNKEFGIRVSNGLTVVNARVLPAPMLEYHASGLEANAYPHVGKWNMINKKMVNGGTVDYWTCISFSSQLPQKMVHQFCADLVDVCSRKGINFQSCPLLPIRFWRPDQLETALLKVHTGSTEKFATMGQDGKQLQLLIIILPDYSGSYGKIKRVCETELGIVSQCIQPHHAQERNEQYLENVSLKINVKVGGRNTMLSKATNRSIPLVYEARTIIFGADVTHPQPGKNSIPSIAAVVASMDWPEVTKYRGLFSSQSAGREIIEDLYKVTDDAQGGVVHGGMIRELLKAFNKSTKHWPARIIFYRDGVGEAQFNEVLLLEVDAIRKACLSIMENYIPKVTFVVVQKRHHTRFFTNDRSGNISPGTVVDTKICHPTEFDFYLNSHAGVLGTSRPAHYHVLFDENKFSADDLQRLTYNLCYTNARCTQSCSIVPPAYYAHLVAYRARYYIEDIEPPDSGGRETRETTAAVQSIPAIKKNVEDVMFYC